MTNPPFGKKSSTTIVAEDGKVARETEIIERDGFWATTSNKQLHFLQHVKTLLKQNGRAAIVVPDNVLFEGGAGETVRRPGCQSKRALHRQGAGQRNAAVTKKLWIYDFRTNKHFTRKTNPLKREDLDEFVQCYNPENRYQRTPTWSDKDPDGRWRVYDYDELLINRDKASLDIFWLRDESREESDNLTDPDFLAQDIVVPRRVPLGTTPSQGPRPSREPRRRVEDFEAALEQFREIAVDLGAEHVNPKET
jgi:type I restriction enzyme M protein